MRRIVYIHMRCNISHSRGRNINVKQDPLPRLQGRDSLAVPVTLPRVAWSAEPAYYLVHMQNSSPNK